MRSLLPTEPLSKNMTVFGKDVHIDDPQILAVDDCVVLADITGDFAEMIVSYIGNPFMEPGNLCLKFLPVP